MKRSLSFLLTAVLLVGIFSASASAEKSVSLAFWEDIVDLCSDSRFLAGLCSDGIVKLARISIYEHQDWLDEAWDRFSSEVSSWDNISAIAAGGYCLIGLRNDGTAVSAAFSVPSEPYEPTAPDVSSWSDVVSVTVNGMYAVGVRSDGTALVAVMDSHGETEDTSLHVDDGAISDILSLEHIQKVQIPYVSWYNRSFPTVMTEDGRIYIPRRLHMESYADYYSCGWMTVALLHDGTVEIVSGWEDETDLDTLAEAILSWRDLEQVVCSEGMIVGLKEDGTVTWTSMWEDRDGFALDSWHNIAKLYISENGSHVAGLTKDGHVVATVIASPDTWDDDEEDGGDREEDEDDEIWYGDEEGGDDGVDFSDTSYLAEVSSWSDMDSVALRAEYIAGVRKDGHVLFACNPHFCQIELLPGDSSVPLVAGFGGNQPINTSPSLGSAIPSEVLDARDGVFHVFLYFYDEDKNTIGFTSGTAFSVGISNMDADTPEWTGKPTSQFLTYLMDVYPGIADFDYAHYEIFFFADNMIYSADHVSYPEMEPYFLASLTTSDSIAGRSELRFAHSESVSLGDTVYMLGFPTASAGEECQYGSFPNEELLASGNIRSVLRDDTNTKYFQIASSSIFKSRGGPLLDAAGRVIGMIVPAPAGENTSYLYAVTSDSLTDLLMQMGVSFYIAAD